MNYLAKAKSAKGDTDNTNTLSDLSPLLLKISETINVYEAYKDSRKAKRRKLAVYEFELNLCFNLNTITEGIRLRAYDAQAPRLFTIYCEGTDKYRTISASAFKDNVTQRAIYNEIYPLCERSLIFDNYGCRKGKGNHRASDRCQEFMRKHSGEMYYLQLDIRKYYYSIDHTILRAILLKRIKCEQTVDLVMQFVNKKDGIGLNVGSLLSQLFGLIYLDILDNYVKRVLKVPHYIRYVDDMVLIGLTREEAYRIRDHLSEFIDTNLNLKFSKWKIAKIKKGINFVGYRTWKSKRFIRKRSLYVFSKALRKRKIITIQAVLAHAKYTSSYRYLCTRVLKTLTYKELHSFGGSIKNDLFLLRNSAEWAAGNVR